MKRFFLTTFSLGTALYTIWYMSFGNPVENSGALSKIGLAHPFYFALWGVLTYASLYLLIDAAFKKWTKYRFYHILMALSGIGMLLTLTCDFDYDHFAQWLLHCIGSLLFSVSTSITVFLFFLLCYKKARYFKVMTWLIGAVLLVDLFCLLRFQETALIETVPVFIGYLALNRTIYKKEAAALAVGTRA